MRSLFTTTLALAGVSVLLSSCEPVPTRKLDAEDKRADMYWLFSQYKENYAPLEYKEERNGFKFAELNAKYLAEAEATTSNEDFYGVMFRYIAEFKDAHNSGALKTSSVPGTAKVAYLGFKGVRQGDAFKVTGFFATSKPGPAYPIKSDDVITKVDGTPVRDIVLKEMARFRNLGSDDANLTAHMGRLFLRLSLQGFMPKSDVALLTVKRGDKETEVALPWITKDFVEFSKEQKSAGMESDLQSKMATGSKVVLEEHDGLLQIGFLRADGKISPLPALADRINSALPGFNVWNTYQYISDIPEWIEAAWSGKRLGTLGELIASGVSASTALSTERNVPSRAIPVADAETYPAYITREKTGSGESKLVGYLRIDTFSIQQQFGEKPKSEKDVISEVRQTIKTMQELGVKDLVLDLIDNGGGSLSLGTRLAQEFSKKPLLLPAIQLRLSDGWRRQFRDASTTSQTDTERELARRLANQLDDEVASGKRLSSRLPLETLMGFPMEGAENDQMNIVVMVNEMCASMCDIFTAILKDNGTAKIVGAKTMGAGGNVVSHFHAPNSHLEIRQTESLLLRGDGKTYIENNGVDPDVVVAVNESAASKYDAVREKALETLLGKAPEKAKTESK